MDEEFFDEGECKKRGIPTNVFVHDNEQSDHEELVRLAKDICRECPFQVDCFMYGVQHQEVGVWGGAWLELPPESAQDFT